MTLRRGITGRARRGCVAVLCGSAEKSIDEEWRQLGLAVLKGMPPSGIPFEQSTQLELVISVKASRVRGLKVPQSVWVSADEVIE